MSKSERKAITMTENKRDLVLPPGSYAYMQDVTKGVVVLEYASEGHVVGTGRRYSNRYISVLTLREGEVAHWRDYLDPVAVFDALGWPPR